MAEQSLCKIDGCNKPTHNGIYCSMHAERIRKHGDPNKGAFKPRGICDIEGCQSPHYGNGYCLAHWKRFKKYGDPLAGSTGWGEVRRWLDNVALGHAGDECLIFPYSRTPSGYGHLNISGAHVGAHVYVAEKVHGPKPDNMEVLHSCGRGHDGCVAPRHLRWGTRTQNINDAVAHGTWGNRRYVGNRKYSAEQIAAVRRLLESGISQTEIAQISGVSQTHVSRIKNGHRSQ